MQPQPWSQADDSELRKIKGVCLDIDETLSTRGKLTTEAYAALWRLKAAGYAVIPITGRPAGWCDLIARFWPVDAVVGENGAFVFFMQDGVRRRVDTPGGLGNKTDQMKALSQKILGRFPKAKWASDQVYREFDLAIDVCEDVPAWPRADVDELLAICHGEGAHAKLSSVHVNAWFGDFDKCKGLQTWMGITSAKLPQWDELLFIGDSPNDEPMFQSFKYSVGVANLKTYLDRLKSPPKWITAAESGAGFAEMVQRLTRDSGGSKNP